jgi:NhaP-type Na+/H+ or K+/H+ antiporter
VKPAARRDAETIDALPDPRESEEWFQKLPPERRAEMTRAFRAGLQRGVELETEQRRRIRSEALRMGGILAFFGFVCSGLGSLFVSGGIGILLGWGCSRIDAARLLTATVGMVAFFAAQYLLHGSAWMALFATLPVGALCALLGYQREERGMD